MFTLIIHFEPIPDDDFDNNYTGGTSVVSPNSSGSKSATITPISKNGKLLSYEPKKNLR